MDLFKYSKVELLISDPYATGPWPEHTKSRIISGAKQPVLQMVQHLFILVVKHVKKTNTATNYMLKKLYLVILSSVVSCDRSKFTGCS